MPPGGAVCLQELLSTVVVSVSLASMIGQLRANVKVAIPLPLRPVLLGMLETWENSTITLLPAICFSALVE